MKGSVWLTGSTSDEGVSVVEVMKGSVRLTGSTSDEGVGEDDRTYQ